MDQHYRAQGLDMIGISVKEIDYSDVARLRPELRPGLHDRRRPDRRRLGLYGVYALPTQVFINPDGIVRAVVNGPLTADQATQPTSWASILPGASARQRAPDRLDQPP